MHADVLIVYASKHGSTQQVARGIGEKLRGLGLTTQIERAEEVDDVSGYRAVLLGGSIYMGRWHQDAHKFLRRHRQALAELPFAVFALGPGKNTPKDFANSRRQLDHALAKTPELEPQAIAVFGGVIQPEHFHFPLNHMRSIDLRDWNEIRGWAAELPTLLDLEPIVHHREAVPF